MMPTDVNALLDLLGVPVIRPAYARPPRMVTGISWDSREVGEGTMFLALPGEQTDGNDYIFQALAAGSPLVIATRRPSDALLAQAAEFEARIVYTEDAEATLATIAGWYREHLSATVIGVTGSTGKTTTKDLIASILSTFVVTVATKANQNNELGVPNTILSADDHTQALVVEMGMRGSGQLEKLCRFVRPQIAVITNIGVSHIELLGSRRNIALAKGEVIEGLPDGDGCAVLNGDDDFTPFLTERFVRPKNIRLVTYGFGPECMVRGTELVLDEQARPSFKINFPEGDVVSVSLPLSGGHNAENALAAAAVAYAYGLGPAIVKRGLESVQATGMRMEVVHTSSGMTVINDAYNANPESMAAALNTLSVMGDGRKVAVLGDMGELGTSSVSMHQQMGELVARCGIDLLVCIGKLSRNIASAACSAGMDASRIFHFDGVDDALALLRQQLRPGDTVLVKASHAMHLERVVEGLVD